MNTGKLLYVLPLKIWSAKECPHWTVLWCHCLSFRCVFDVHSSAWLPMVHNWLVCCLTLHINIIYDALSSDSLFHTLPFSGPTQAHLIYSVLAIAFSRLLRVSESEFFFSHPWHPCQGVKSSIIKKMDPFFSNPKLVTCQSNNFKIQPQRWFSGSCQYILANSCIAFTNPLFPPP